MPSEVAEGQLTASAQLALQEALGALPPSPQDLPLYGHGSVRYDARAAEEDRAPVGTDPSALAAPRQQGAALHQGPSPLPLTAAAVTPMR